MFSQEYPEQIASILARIESLKSDQGLLQGGGWLDGMSNFRGSYSLTNQVWLYRLYRDFDMPAQMESARAALESFWNGPKGFYVDRLGSDRLDTLGNAMLLDEGLVPAGRAEAVLAALAGARTRYGYLNLSPVFPAGECSQRPHEYQNATVWPFVEYRVARAFMRYGRTEDARAIKELMESRRGVNEWYSPLDGKPEGSRAQLWTACAYLGVSSLLGR